jgi:DMSO/TMAO reductase YedYZ molybdopterin-dependent catalytic subunit
VSVETPVLPPGQGLIRGDRWPVVGETAPRDSALPWEVAVCGLVGHTRLWPLERLLRWPRETWTVDVHCVTRWSKPGMRFSGVPLAALLAPSGPTPEAAWVRFVARSERDHDTSLPMDVAMTALVAFEAEGAPLAPEHGGPVRVVTPGRYFYKSIKWLERVELMAGNRLGYWERGPGYHDGADPWREERYVTGSVPPDLRARLIARRVVAGRDLLAVDFSGEDLEGFDAGGATLRACGFRGARLAGADFTGANLSNADLSGADLRGARLGGADCEGASFDGADLSGADFTGASLFGASFSGLGGARLDAATRIDPDRVLALSDAEAAWLGAALAAASRRG